MERGAAAFLAASLIAAGCSGPPDYRVNEPVGPPPQRAVSLAPAITEMLFALGVGDRVVGATEYCDYPDAARAIPRVGGFSVPNPETILALDPELLVVSPAPQNKEAVDLLHARGLPVMVVAEPRQVPDIRPVIVALGAQFDRAEVAEELADSIDGRLARLAALTEGRDRPRVLMTIQSDPLVVCARNSYPAELVELAGGDVVVPESERPYPTLSLEAAVRAAPDVIVETFMDVPDPQAASEAVARRWERMPSIPAVANGRVHVVDGDALLRPGPRAPAGVAALISLLHPDLAHEAVALMTDPRFAPDGPVPRGAPNPGGEGSAPAR